MSEQNGDPHGNEVTGDGSGSALPPFDGTTARVADGVDGAAAVGTDDSPADPEREHRVLPCSDERGSFKLHTSIRRGDDRRLEPDDLVKHPQRNAHTTEGAKCGITGSHPASECAYAIDYARQHYASDADNAVAVDG